MYFRLQSDINCCNIIKIYNNHFVSKSFLPAKISMDLTKSILMDYSQSITTNADLWYVRNISGLSNSSNLIISPLFGLLICWTFVKLFPGKCEELIWQPFEILPDVRRNINAATIASPVMPWTFGSSQDDKRCTPIRLQVTAVMWPRPRCHSKVPGGWFIERPHQKCMY